MSFQHTASITPSMNNCTKFNKTEIELYFSLESLHHSLHEFGENHPIYIQLQNVYFIDFIVKALQANIADGEKFLLHTFEQIEKNHFQRVRKLIGLEVKFCNGLIDPDLEMAIYTLDNDDKKREIMENWEVPYLGIFRVDKSLFYIQYTGVFKNFDKLLAIKQYSDLNWEKYNGGCAIALTIANQEVIGSNSNSSDSSEDTLVSAEMNSLISQSSTKPRLESKSNSRIHALCYQFTDIRRSNLPNFHKESFSYGETTSADKFNDIKSSSTSKLSASKNSNCNSKFKKSDYSIMNIKKQYIQASAVAPVYSEDPCFESTTPLNELFNEVLSLECTSHCSGRLSSAIG